MRFWNGYKIHLNDFTQSKKIVYGIALNVYREWVRSSIKNDNLALEDYWTQLAEEDQITCTDHWSSNDYEEKHLELKQKLREAIAKLPEKQRLVLEYRFLHRLSRKETAVKMNTTEDNVYTYQKRAIKTLQQIINSTNNSEHNNFSEI